MVSIDFKKNLRTILKQCFSLIVSLLKTKTNYDYIELYPILKTSDMNKIIIAKTLLQDSNIHFNVKNENLQNLFALGQYTTGFNPLIGPMIIEVPKENCDKARNLLKLLIENE